MSDVPFLTTGCTAALGALLKSHLVLRKSTLPARAPEAGCALHVFFVSAKVVAQKLDLGSRQHVQRQHLPEKKRV